MSFPKLPARAAYLTISNPTRRNALGLSVLRDLKTQLEQYNRNRSGEKSLFLPQAKPMSTESLRTRYKWLVDSQEWDKERGHQPKVLVLRSEGPVFSSGHDLRELANQGAEEVEETFSLCRLVMSLIQKSPIPVVCPIQGLATAAGFQLAMTSDYPIAMADTQFQLPGVSIGLPCTSPSVPVSRRLPPALAYRLLLTGEPIRADQLHGAVDVVPVPEHAESTDTAKAAFEKRVDDVVRRLVNAPSQPQALGKWAYNTQLEMDQYQASQMASRMMALHAKTDDGKEGINAFLEKRSPVWVT